MNMKAELLLVLSEQGIDISKLDSSNISLKALKEKYLKLIGGGTSGYGQFNKNGDFDKSSYYKIDTPIGPIG